MKKTALWMLIILVLASCGDNSRKKETGEATAQVEAAYRAKNYQLLLTLADSLRQTGALSDADGYYWQGYAYDRLMQRRMAEFYWRMSMDAAKKASAADEVAVYAKSATRLANLLGMRGDFESALKVAEPAAKHLEALHCDSTSDYTNLLIFIGLFQSRQGQSSEVANASYGRAYDMHLKAIKATRSDAAYKNAIAGLINIAYNCIETAHYEEAISWSDRYGKLLSEYEMRDDAQPAYVDKQWARYHIYRATALEGLGRKDEADKVYGDYLRTKYSQTPEGRIEAADFLATAGRWGEAADNYNSLDSLADEASADYTLENIQKTLLKKFLANKMAGRQDSADIMARQICSVLDSAITVAHHMDIEEQQAIRQKEEQLLEQQSSTTRQRTFYTLIALAVLLAAFFAYTLYRHRLSRRLAAAHAGLKTDYTQLEENATSKERVVHSIQTKLLPKSFPSHDNLDIYATLVPAKNMGGNFYDFQFHDNRLYFCVGDVKGVGGITSALTMAVTRALFRSAAVHESQPERITADINEHLAAGSESSLPVTLFVGVLDMKTRRLAYTNAGSQAPLVVGKAVETLPVDANIPVGQQTGWQFTVQEATLAPGTVVFLYTDGLIRAENSNHEPFGELRMKGEALQGLHGLDPAPQPLIERMTDTLHRYTGDTQQADDVTMLALRFRK